MTEDSKLTNLSDDELISNVKNSLCNESFAILSSKYEKVYYKVCQRYAFALASSGINPDDVYDEKNYILWICILKFDTSKGTKFSTWFGNYAKYVCLNSITSRKLLINYSQEEIKSFIEEKQQKPTNEDIKDPRQFENLLYIFGSLSNSRYRRVINLRYFNSDKLTWRDIAQKMGISIQTAISVHNKALKTLKNKIKTKNSL